MLTLSGYQVRILEQQDWPRARDIVADAGMVIVSVPIHVTEQVIAQLPPLPSDCILVDLASVKSDPLQAMLAAHDGPVLGLHPMFGPDSGSTAKQVVVWCDGRQPEAYQWFLRQIRCGALGCTELALSSTIRTWLLSVRCAILLPSLMGCIWRKRTSSLSSFWRYHRRFIDWSWRWSGVCSPRPAAVCGHYYVVGAQSGAYQALL